RKIQGDNRVTFGSEQEAKNTGRRLCKRCETLDLKAAKGDGGPGSASGNGERTGGLRDTGGGEAGESRPEKPPGAGPPIETNGSTGLLPEFVAVTKVLSGGTLVLDNGDHAVLAGVVCPGKGQPHAQECTRYLNEQTRGRTVRLTYEAGGCRPTRRDELGRLVGYVVPEPNGRDLGGELIFQGYAWVDRGAPFARQAEYVRHEEDAWRAGRGIWERNSGADEGESVLSGRHAHCFHAPGCRHVKLMSGVMTLTLNEAKGRRLVPCGEYRGKH
ncbi:MAG TPA: thermonuclease family protein, partial [Phycisphaerae bacterium]|nr:thermonuclease family protein [Phycisphaerae bacterium]